MCRTIGTYDTELLRKILLLSLALMNEFRGLDWQRLPSASCWRTLNRARSDVQLISKCFLPKCESSLEQRQQ